MSQECSFDESDVQLVQPGMLAELRAQHRDADRVACQVFYLDGKNLAQRGVTAERGE